MDLAPIVRFTGSYPHTVDGKNRLTIPSRWRSETLDTLYASADHELGVIKLLTTEERDRQGQVVLNHPGFTPAQAKEWRRHLFGSTPECPLDREGRIVLPSAMMDELGLTKVVMLVGAGETVEVWDRTKHKEHEDAFRAQYRHMAKEAGL